jgi:DNA-binding MarR family transcriptional regulator
VSDELVDPTTAQRVWIAMSSVVLDNERRQHLAEEVGMSFARVRALRRIAHGPLSMGELAQRCGIDPPYATVVVDDLQARGLVVRRDHPEDRRAKIVVATEEGRDLAARAERILDEPPAGLAGLAAGELAELERILTKLKVTVTGQTKA